MGTIAEAADVSRPALYQYFSSKEDVFRAAVGWQLAASVADIQDEAAKSGEASDRLFAVLTPVVHMHRSAGGGHAGAGSPLYGEMLDETYARAGDLWDEFERSLLAALCSILGRDAAKFEFSAVGPTIEDVAVILFYGTKGIAAHTRDTDDALCRVRELVILTLRGLSAR